MVGTVFFDLESLGFDKFGDPVVCWCVCDCVGGVWSAVGVDEVALLRSLFGKLNELAPGELVSFNGYSFDVPFLWVKALKYGLVLPKCLVDGYLQLDLWYELTRRGKGKLSDFASILGLESVGDGKDVPDLFAHGDFDSIKKHCESDVLVLKTLYERAKLVGLV